jgi:tRNA 2-selenouridine synthase
MPIKITVKKALEIQNAQFIDTRTPKEYNEDHLPNAVNIPILSNEERAVVGTLYKKVSQDKAIEKGIEFFSAKLPLFMKEISKYKDTTLIIHCWRGGMRSRTVAALLESLNFKVFQLEGGYKAYRTYVRKKLESYSIKPKIILLCGMTGTGKTQLLVEFASSIDLEGIARHKGSLFGGIGLIPNNQKNFENVLLQRLDAIQNEKYIIVEGEGKRVGNCIIPAFFWKAMKNAIIVEVTRTMEQRADAIAKEYFDTKEKVLEGIEIVKILKKNMSNKNKEKTIRLIEQKEYTKAVEILLKEYYDPLYSYTLKNVGYDFSVDNKDVQKAKDIILNYIQKN